MIKITKKEWIWVLAISLGLLLLTTLPYVYGKMSEPEDKTFMGYVYNVVDHTQYLSWYKAFQTDFLITNHQTSEENPAIFFNLLWWMLAQFGKFTGLHYALVYQLFRWVSGLLFFGMAYLFISFVFKEQLKRWTAFLMVAFSSGFGWFLIVLKYLLHLPDTPFPLDIYVSEGNSFFCLLAFPHFLQATAFILGALLLLLIGERKAQLRYAVYAGIVALFLGLTHAYDLFIVWTIPIAYAGLLFIRERKFPLYWFKAMLITGLLSWPPALYSFLLTKLNPIWEEILGQFSNAGVFSPTPPHMLILMGLPLILAIIVLVLVLLKKMPAVGRTEIGQFLLVWFFVGWLLTYMPAEFQIHMINSWQIPVILLAVFFLVDQVLPFLQKRNSRLFKRTVFLFLIITLVIPTNLYLFAWRFLDLSRNQYPYYLYNDEVEMMHMIEEITPEDSVIMSAYESGKYIPGISGRTAFLSHWAQTVDYFDKMDFVSSFYAMEYSENQLKEAMLKYNINYIFYGPAERALGELQPEQFSFLEKVKSLSQVDLFKVILDE